MNLADCKILCVSDSAEFNRRVARMMGTQLETFGTMFYPDDVPKPIILPDFAHDAETDYRVLEWARANMTPDQFVDFCDNLLMLANYNIPVNGYAAVNVLRLFLATYQVGWHSISALAAMEGVE